MVDSQSSDLEIKSRVRDYRVHFRGDAIASLRGDIRPGDVVILDREISRHHGDKVRAALGDLEPIVIDATEDQKSYEGATGIIADLIARGFRKNNRLIAIGGGITQDLTAFVASILYRGVSWIFYPTTLLAQGDSCIGSKTSINFRTAKNQLGGFYPPGHVVIDTSFLGSLPPEQVMSGLGEMAHYFLIAGRPQFEHYRRSLDAALRAEGLSDLISRSLAIKKRYVEADEFDEGERQVLNYGHTFGHAIESLTDYRVPHGIAVSFGMDLANHISVRLGLLDESVRIEAREVLRRIWAGTDLGPLDQARYEAALKKDKKNADGKLGLILTRGYGQMFKQLVPLDAQFSGWLREWFSEDKS